MCLQNDFGSPTQNHRRVPSHAGLSGFTSKQHNKIKNIFWRWISITYNHGLLFRLKAHLNHTKKNPRSWKRHSHGTNSQILEEALSWYKFQILEVALSCMVPSPRSWKKHSHGTKFQILEEALSWYQVPDPGRGTLMVPSPRSWKWHSHDTKS